jgi:imidazolonepropionase
MHRKLFRNARIHTPVDSGSPLGGSRQGEVIHIPRGALVTRDGLIADAGPEGEVLSRLTPGDVDLEVDCGGRGLIPGFVDAHTHLCFAGMREAEFELRLAGIDYLEILRRGGGILSTVRAVRSASEEGLFAATRNRALTALRLGTTTVEIKSGYGLETGAELKMLRVIRRVERETPLDVVATFMGAHAVPEEHAQTPEDYVDLVVGEMLPAVAAQGIARFCDVFCEEGAFSLDQSRRILEAGRAVGLGAKIHADEIHRRGGSALAAELRAVSAEHLLCAGESDLRAMAAAGVVGVVLPATAYSLRKPFAPARKMVEWGLPVAVATDCNPGTSYTESMPFVFGLAVLGMGLSVSEALVASTLNGAYAVGMARRVGSLQGGKQADFLLLDGDGPAALAYHAGVSPVTGVYKGGEAVWAS